MVTELSSIEDVNPREVWPNEASDFTPWLAEHIDLLGEALGLDIEITETEAAVGAFSLDILGKVSGSDGVVIIENQLEQTDHGHLGQLLAYSAGLDARIVVWISPEVRDEHRQAIHWLNERTTDAVAFFGVKLEVWQIGNSLPAPRFNVVAQPSEFQRQLVKETQSERTPKRIAYHDFYVDLLQRLLATSPRFTTSDPAKVRDNSWMNFGAGRSGFRVGWAFTAGQFRVELYIDTGDRAENKSAYDQLQRESGDIEFAVGDQLTWERLDNRRASRVFSSRQGTIDSPPDDLEEFKQWAVDLLPRFRDAFEPRIAALDLDALTAEAATEEEATP